MGSLEGSSSSSRSRVRMCCDLPHCWAIFAFQHDLKAHSMHMNFGTHTQTRYNSFYLFTGMVYEKQGHIICCIM